MSKPTLWKENNWCDHRFDGTGCAHCDAIQLWVVPVDVCKHGNAFEHDVLADNIYDSPTWCPGVGIGDTDE